MDQLEDATVSTPSTPSRAPDATAAAHGRVNLMGDHTDYNGGFVLPICIPQETRVRLWKRDDARVHAFSENVSGGLDSFPLDRPERTGAWTDYVKGVLFALRRDGHAVGGFDVFIDSNVPVGSGLSSSAALDVALLRALRQAFALELDDVRLALLARQAETEFVGAPVGIMDPLVISVGRTDAALYLNTRSLDFDVVPLLPSADLVVVDSGVRHAHSTGGYASRTVECAEATRVLGVRLLTDLRYPEEESRLNALPPLLLRRARHVITENARVHETVEAFLRGSLKSAGALLRESHASLRDDYEVSIPELDRIVEEACSDRDVFGARMTGGGFGGCVVILARKGTGERVGARLIARVAPSGLSQASVVLPPNS